MPKGNFRHKALHCEKVDKRLREKKRKIKIDNKLHKRWSKTQARIHSRHADSPYACPCAPCNKRRQLSA